MNREERVRHRTLHYDEVDIASIAAFIAVVMKRNPEMFDEILCRIAMGVGGYKTNLITTRPNSGMISSLESEMLTALKEDS